MYLLGIQGLAVWEMYVFQRMLSSLSVKWKMGLAVALPTVGLLIFAVAFCYGQWKTVENMRHTVQLTEFSQSVSELVHELQVERGRTAGYLGSGKAASAESQLETQSRRSDQFRTSFLSAAADFEGNFETDTQREHLSLVRNGLSGLDAHRTNVRRTDMTVPEAVGPYTATINNLINLIADEAALVGDADLSGALQGLLQLTNAKEAAGLERARGSAALASGQLNEATHQALLSLHTTQQQMFARYRETMPDEFDRALDRVEAGTAGQRVASIRSDLHRAGYGGALPDVSSNEWFDLTTNRIDDLMAVTEEVSQHIHSVAMSKQQQLTTLVWAVIIASVLLTVFTVLVSYVLVSSIVRPMALITQSLDELSKGATDLKIAGVERGDEIGVLARAARQFMEMSRQREALMRQNAENEQKALVERRNVLDRMANEVKEATHTTVSQIVLTAEDLASNAQTMRSRLNDASSNATKANQATSESLDGTQRASDLALELNAAIAEVAESIMRGDKMARETVQLAVDSRQTVEELDEATQQIGDFVRVITELAEQTNLLALNATIESARAGEHGKGFAVVASEIKQLASQTNTSATQITERVNQIQSRTRTAVDAINRISSSIEQLGGVTSSVAAAVEEQRASTDSFTGFLNSNRAAIEDVARQVADLTRITQETSESATSMSRQVDEMTTASRSANEEIPKIVQRAVAAADNRNAPRTKTDQPVTVTQNNASRPAVLKDVSTSGARLNQPSSGKVNLTLPGQMGQVTAKTAWSNETESGVEFETELSGNLMDRLLAMSKKDSAA